MRRVALVAFCALFVTAAWVGSADAISQLKYSKQISITFLVTPTPIAYRAPAPPRQLAYDPQGVRDVPLAPFAVAVATPQGNIPVTFNAKADPTGQYLHFVANTTILKAGYGSNTYSCPFAVYGSWTTAFNITDWVYDSPTVNFGYPTYVYSTTSQLAWIAEGVTSTYKAYANDGTPGETAFTSPAGSKQVCIDLSLTVPASLSPGAYTATLQYNLVVTL